MNARGIARCAEECDAAAVGRPARCVVVGRIRRQAPNSCRADQRDIDVGVVVFLAGPRERHLLAVGSKGWPCLFAGKPRQRHDSGRRASRRADVRRTSHVAATTTSTRIVARAAATCNPRPRSSRRPGGAASRTAVDVGILSPRIHRRAFDRRNEAVAAPRHGLDEAWRLGRIAQRLAQAVDDGVQTVLEVDERAVRPESLAQLLARDQIAGPLQQLASTFSDCSCRPTSTPALRSSPECRSSSKLLNRSGRRAGAGISAIASLSGSSR